MPWSSLEKLADLAIPRSPSNEGQLAGLLSEKLGFDSLEVCSLANSLPIEIGSHKHLHRIFADTSKCSLFSERLEKWQLCVRSVFANNLCWAL